MKWLTREGADARILFGTRCARLFGYGLLSVVLISYLTELGLSAVEIDVLLALTLLGDTAVSLWITTTADRIGRRRQLLVGALLMVLAGVVFALTGDFWLLLLAATVGVISPSGNEVGPFLPIEQAALAQTVPAAARTGVLAWYNLVGSLATATGALIGGLLAQFAELRGLSGAERYRPVIFTYAAVGVVLALAFARLSPAAEAAAPPPDAPRSRLGMHRSSGVVLKLASLFALDAFAGGFVIQSVVAYWFVLRFNAESATLGMIFFGANLLAGVSALSAARLARRFGLVNTMVFTHLPSNVLLLLVPLMPTLELAVAVLLLRFSISQMDVPARQSYTLAVVAPEERSAASGVTGVARSVGAALAQFGATTLVMTPALMSVPFFLAGGLKILYDVLLYRSFVTQKPPEEQGG